MKHKPVLVLILALIMTLYNPQLLNANQRILEEPKLVIGRHNSMPIFKAGEEGTLIIPVENVQGGLAKNVNFTLIVDNVENFPFEMKKMSFQTSMSSIDGYSSESAVFFGMKVSPTAESKIYPINIKIDYTSENGSEGQSSSTIYVKIENENKSPLLKLVGIQLENEQIDSGESKTVELKIKNDGHMLARDIDIKLSGFTANGLRLDQPVDTFNLKEFKGQEFKYIPFKIYADPAIESGSYTLDLTMKYKDEFNKDYTQESKVYINVEGTGGDGTNKKAVPRLIIDNYSYGGEYATAGQTFSLQMSLLNTSQWKELNNIKVSLSSEENIFSPVNSSNSFFINNIPAEGSIQKAILLKPKVDASNKTYNINVDVEYEDDKGNKYSAKELIGIPVTQDIKLLISEIEIPPNSFAGSPLGLSVDFYNTGRALIRNLMIHTEGDFRIQDGTIYIGNLEAGKSDYYDVTITPEKEGPLTGKILFDYDDEIGKHYQTEKTFNLEVMKQEILPTPNFNPEMDQNIGLKWKKPVLIGAGVLVPGIVGLMVHRRRRKKHEEVSLDE